MRLKTAIDLHSTVRLALLPAEETTPLLHDLDKCLSEDGDDDPVPATPYLSPDALVTAADPVESTQEARSMMTRSSE